MKRNFTFVIKPTGACNAKCIYCSAYREDEGKEKMNLAVVEELFSKLRRYGDETGNLGGAQFIWHGGEPLLMGEAFYYEVMKLQRKYFENTEIDVENDIQSNLLLLDDSKAKMLVDLLTNKRGMGVVGTSFDIVENIRVLPGGDYTARWMKARDLLLKHKLNYGVVYVVHKKSLDRVKDLVKFFTALYRENGATARFNPLYAEGRAKNDSVASYSLTPEDWGRFLIELYGEWIAMDNRPHFNPMVEYYGLHHHGDYRLTCDSAGRCFETHFGLDVDGSIYQCGRSMDNRSLRLGSLFECSIEELMLAADKKRIKNRIVFLHDTLCRNCKWWSYCHGGCSVDAMISHGVLGKKTTWCDGRRLFFETIFKEPMHHGMVAVNG